MSNKKTREYLETKGFKRIGSFSGMECVAKKIEEDSFAYHMLFEGVTVWDFAKTMTLSEVALVSKIKEVLYE